MSIQKFIEKVCVQKALYWAASKDDGFGGHIWDVPVEISCRWEEKIKIVSDTFGKEIITIAEVLVPQDLDVQGILWLGGLEDLLMTEDWVRLASGEIDPMSVDRAFSIKRFDRIPMIRSTTVFVRTAYL
jgi:hypothetical protein